MSGLVLLVSYPKSGNTWFRAVLNSMWLGGAAIDLNSLEIASAADRTSFDRYLGVSSTDLTVDEILSVRPQVYALAADEQDWSKYLKVHDAWIRSARGVFPFSESSITCAIYIVRDPRDVAVSFSNHLDISIDATIRTMANPHYTFSRQQIGVDMQLPQLLSTWDVHVRSWVQDTHFPVHLMRYEDMVSDPENTFAEAFTFIGLHFSRELLRKVVAATSFKVLQAQEAEGGFRERPPRTSVFFRKGMIGNWKEVLSLTQSREVVNNHKSTMQWLGYLQNDPAKVALERQIS